MNKSKLFFPLSVAIMAVLLIFVSAAQAGPKKPNPGHDPDNPSENRVTLNYFTAGAAFPDGQNSSCFDPVTFCDTAKAPLVDYMILNWGFDPLALSLESASADAACLAAEHTYGRFAALYLGGGQLDLVRHGNNGSMHHITMNAGLSQASVALVEAETFAGSFADGDAFVLGGIYDKEEACNYDLVNGQICFSLFGRQICYEGPIGLGEYCEWAAAGGLAVADSGATAASFGDGFGQGGAVSGGTLGQWTDVYAANIEEFHSVVSGSAGNFVWAQSGSQSAALAEAFALDFVAVYQEICDSEEVWQLDDEWHTYQEWCNSDFGYVADTAVAFALAYADAQAKAFASTYATFNLPAHYINENGTGDTIIFGNKICAFEDGTPDPTCENQQAIGYAGGGVAFGNVKVSCEEN